MLAIGYLNGTLVGQNIETDDMRLVEITRLLTLAAAQGFEPAQQLLNQLIEAQNAATNQQQN